MMMSAKLKALTNDAALKSARERIAC